MRRSNKESGAAFIEMAVALPFSIFLLIAFLDMGNLLKRYISVSRIAYEGVRIASDISRLEQRSYNTSNIDTSTAHNELHEKIMTVATGYGFADGYIAEIETERSSVDDTVTVFISAIPPDLFFSFLDPTFTVKSTVKGPYLYITDGA